MSTAIAGNPVKIKFGTSSPPANEILGIDSASMPLAEVDLIETTAFSDGVNKTRITGLMDSSIEFSGHFIPSDTSGQLALITNALAGTLVYANFLYDGSAGYGCKGYLSSVKLDAAVAGSVKISFSFKATGPVTAGSPPTIA